MAKKKILHIIDSLKIGGAEKIVTGIVNGLSEYDHAIVTFSDGSEFGFENHLHKDSIINLNCNSRIDYFFAIIKLSNIIHRLNPKVIHSHLFWPTIVSRLAIKKGIPLVSTYYSMIYDKSNDAQYIPFLLLLDRITYRHRYHTIFISNVVSELVSNAVGIKKNKNLVYPFIDNKFYFKSQNSEGVRPIRAVSIGNYRKEKNYIYIVNALSKFSKEEIILDIYGNGDREYLQKIIRNKGMDNIRLHGNAVDVVGKLHSADVFIMASAYEGFGIALAEAMASGLNIVISDIDIFREVTQNSAIYFDLKKYKSLQRIIENAILDSKTIINKEEMVEISHKYGYNNFLKIMGNKYTSIISDTKIS